MKNMNDIVEQLVEEIEIPEDVPVVYEVWAIGYDEEDRATEAEMMLATFEDPDQAATFARNIDLADVVELAAADDYIIDDHAYYLSIEVETVVPDGDDSMNIGTIYKKTIELFEEMPDYVILGDRDYEVIEETGNIQISSEKFVNYNKDDTVLIIFADEDEPCPIEYKIIVKGSDFSICEFI